MWSKRLLVGVLTLSLLMVPVAVNADDSLQKFKDVGIAHENFDAIEWLADQGVIKGYDDGSFRPDQVVNRVEFLKMVYLVQGLGDQVLVTEISKVFPDIDVQGWYAPYVVYAKDQGTVEGYPDGNFRPAEEVKRAEALKIVFKEYYDQGVPPSVADLPYVEALDVEAWYYPYLVHGFTRCLIDRTHEVADEDGFLIYGLDEGMTRKEVAELLYRTKSLFDNERIDLCDDDFSDPKDIAAADTRLELKPESVFYAEYEQSDGFDYWGNIDTKAVIYDADLKRPSEQLLFSTFQDRQSEKTFFIPSPDRKKLMSLLPVEAKGGLPSVVAISDVDGKFRLQVYEEGSIRGAAWSDDMRFVAWVSFDQSGQKLYWYELGKPVDQLKSFDLGERFYHEIVGWKGQRLYVNRAIDGTEDPGSLGYFSFKDDSFGADFVESFKYSLKFDFNLSLNEGASMVTYTEHGNEDLGPITGPYRLVYRDLSNPGNVIELAKSDQPFSYPVATKDGKYLLYFHQNSLWRMEMATRASEVLMKASLIEEAIDDVHVEDYDLVPVEVAGDGKSVVVLAKAKHSGAEGLGDLFLVDTTKETLSLEEVVVLAAGVVINPSNVYWID